MALEREIRDRVVREVWLKAPCSYCNGTGKAHTREVSEFPDMWTGMSSCTTISISVVYKLVPGDGPCVHCEGSGASWYYDHDEGDDDGDDE